MALGSDVYLLFQMTGRLIVHAAGAAWEYRAVRQCRLESGQVIFDSGACREMIFCLFRSKNWDFWG